MRQATIIDPEAEAAEIYRFAGADLYDPPGGPALVRLALGDGAVLLTSGLRTDAEYRPDRRAICVRRGLDPIELNFLLCHELAEWWCTELGYDRPNREWVCNRIAARLIAPSPAVRAALKATVGTPEALAAWFACSETVAALRRGEVSGRPLVVVDPAWLMAAGDPWAWPPEPTLRSIAACRLVVPEIERYALTDAPRRALLVAA